MRNFIINLQVINDENSLNIVAHSDTGMTNADLQNISEIIRILSSIFQGQDPDLKYYFDSYHFRRYKNIAHTLNGYKD